jgi:hypothetical protein
MIFQISHHLSVDRTELDVLLRHFQSMEPVAHSTSGIERVDRQHFRDLLVSQFGITESLLMDRGEAIFQF